MRISQSNIFLLRFLRKHLSLLALFALFLFQDAIMASFNNLPNEVLSDIIDFIYPDYYKKLSIAQALNQGNFFGDSPCQVLAGVCTEIPGIMRSCKSLCAKNSPDLFPNYKVTIPDGYTQYLSYLANQEEILGSDFNEKKRIFCFSQATKQILLKNLAFLFFGLDNKRIHLDPPIINPPFYEPFAFALTIMDYEGFSSDHKYVLKDEKEPYIESKKSLLKSFFKNTKSLHERLAILNIPIEISIFMANYLKKIIPKNNYSFSRKTTLERVLEIGGNYPKEFVLFLKENESEIKSQKLNQLLVLSYEIIKSDHDLVNIINFFLKYELTFKGWYGSRKSYSKEKVTSNTIILINLCDTFVENQDRPCGYSCGNISKKIVLEAFYDGWIDYHPKSFWYKILEFLLSQSQDKKRAFCKCENLFNEKFVRFIESYHPKADGSGIQKIICLLRKHFGAFCKLPSIKSEDIWDKDSCFFKNLLVLVAYFQQINAPNGCFGCIKTHSTLLKTSIEYSHTHSENELWSFITLLALTIKKDCSHNLF